MAAWLLAAMRPKGPYPVLLLQGEQGSAKSTTARVLRSLVDPSTSPLRTMPREERDLAIAAGNSWLLAFDNVSSISDWLSDALCRVATGGGFATRELYSNNEEALFDYMRPIVINGIDEVATRHDLLDRCVIVNLPSIPEENRREEAAFWQEFEHVKPWLFGALINSVAAALRNIDKVKLDRLPRMADFAKWVTAAEPSLPWQTGEFMAAYTGNREEAIDLALEADVVATAVRALVEKHGPWEGTATELLAALEGHISEQVKKSKAWPKTARTLGNRLRRSATFLRQTGVQLESGREPGTGRRLIRISRETTVTNVTDVTNSINTAVPGVTQNIGVTQTSSQSNFASQRKGPDYGHCDNSDVCDAKKRTYSKKEDYGEPALWEGEI